MTKRTLKIVFVVLFTHLLFISCSQDEIIDTKKEESTGLDLNFNYSEYFHNPFDSIGIYHNEGLEYAFGAYHKLLNTKSARSQENLENILIDFLNKKNIPGGRLLTDKDLKECINSVLIETRSPKDEIFQNTQQQEFYDMVIALYDNPKIQTPKQFIASVNKIEQKIGGSKLNEVEKSQLLVSTAVAKYSFAFWLNQMLLTRPPIKTRSESGDWLKWFQDTFMPYAEKVLKADYTGAATGATWGLFFGSGVGSIAPGAGTITIGITGAVTGGATGALSGSFFQGIGIDWIWN